ncbi:uncharacterized protein LOC143453197 [Clavelina lepadiformis]|uniref:Uncharacterized protein n=1 Tax=Clavelina lepadiformis TaxID=159417 RepID=A0ABP0G1P9_CLALP
MAVNGKATSLNCEIDREVDGFVLIGETKDERDTIRPGDKVNMEMPPSYQDLQHTNNLEPWSKRNTDFSTLSCTASSSAIESKHCTSHSMSEECHENDRFAAVNDIPFQFASSIMRSLKHAQVKLDGDSFYAGNEACLAECNYNFEVERDVLK